MRPALAALLLVFLCVPQALAKESKEPVKMHNSLVTEILARGAIKSLVSMADGQGVVCQLPEQDPATGLQMQRLYVGYFRDFDYRRGPVLLQGPLASAWDGINGNLYRREYPGGKWVKRVAIRRLIPLKGGGQYVAKEIIDLESSPPVIRPVPAPKEAKMPPPPGEPLRAVDESEDAGLLIGSQGTQEIVLGDWLFRYHPVHLGGPCASVPIEKCTKQPNIFSLASRLDGGKKAVFVMPPDFNWKFRRMVSEPAPNDPTGRIVFEMFQQYVGISVLDNTKDYLGRLVRVTLSLEAVSIQEISRGWEPVIGYPGKFLSPEEVEKLKKSKPHAAPASAQ